LIIISKLHVGKKKKKKKKINLQGVTDIDPDEYFKYELNIFSRELENSLIKWFTLTPVRNNLEDPNDQLIYTAIFKPMKPFKAIIEVVIVKPTGGRWRFKIQLESIEPEIDDQILITSP